MRNGKGQFVKGHKLNIKTRMIKKCKVCSNEMFLVPSLFKTQTVCSRDCNIIDCKKRKSFLGKHHTKESIEKIRQKNLGKISWNKGLKGYRAGEGTRPGIMPRG